MLTTPDYFRGMRVFVDNSLDNVPRMQLTSAFADMMPADFVRETNAWMREFFGTENKILAFGGNSVVMGPDTYEALLLSKGRA
jgi:hypothetical protein